MEHEQVLLPKKHKKRRKKSKNDTQTINAAMLDAIENVGPLMPNVNLNNDTNHKPHITDDEALPVPPIPPTETHTMSSFGNNNSYMVPNGHSNMVTTGSYATNSPGHTNSIINNTQFVYPTGLPSQHSINSAFSGNNGNPIIQQQQYQTVITPHNTTVSHLNRRFSNGNPAPSEVSYVQSVHSHRSTMKQAVQQFDSSQNLFPDIKLVSTTPQHVSSKQLIMDPGYDPTKHEVTVDVYAENDDDDDDDDDLNSESSDLSNPDDIKEVQRAKTERDMKDQMQFLSQNIKSDVDKTDYDETGSSDMLDNNIVKQKQDRQVFRMESQAHWGVDNVNKLTNDLQQQMSNLLQQEHQRVSRKLFTKGRYIVNNNIPQQAYDPTAFMMVQEVQSQQNHYNNSVPTEQLTMIDEINSVNNQQ